MSKDFSTARSRYAGWRPWATAVGLAWSVTAVAPAQAQNPADAELLIQNTAREMVERLEVEREELSKDVQKLYSFVEDLIVQHFDFGTIAKWVLGKNWKNANAAQRSSFTEEFHTLLIRTYAQLLLEYSDQEFQYLPSVYNKDRPDRVLVKTEVSQPDGEAIPIFYRMQYQDESWKIVDFMVGGVSMVQTYRNSFNATIREVGLDGLITQMKDRNTAGAKKLEGT